MFLFAQLRLKISFRFYIKHSSTVSISHSNFSVTDEVHKAGKFQDCLVCAILSHGNENGLVATQDASVFVGYFIEYFSPRLCPALAGKPKIILKTV